MPYQLTGNQIRKETKDLERSCAVLSQAGVQTLGGTCPFLLTLNSNLLVQHENRQKHIYCKKKCSLLDEFKFRGSNIA